MRTAYGRARTYHHKGAGLQAVRQGIEIGEPGQFGDGDDIHAVGKLVSNVCLMTCAEAVGIPSSLGSGRDRAAAGASNDLGRSVRRLDGSEHPACWARAALGEPLSPAYSSSRTRAGG